MFIGDALYRGGRTPAQAGTAARTMLCPGLESLRNRSTTPPVKVASPDIIP